MVFYGRSFPHVICGVKGFRITELNLTELNLIRTPVRLLENSSAFFFPTEEALIPDCYIHRKFSIEAIWSCRHPQEEAAMFEYHPLHNLLQRFPIGKYQCSYRLIFILSPILASGAAYYEKVCHCLYAPTWISKSLSTRGQRLIGSIDRLLTDIREVLKPSGYPSRISLNLYFLCGAALHLLSRVSGF
jgi:hypothetical protein